MPRGVTFPRWVAAVGACAVLGWARPHSTVGSDAPCYLSFLSWSLLHSSMVRQLSVRDSVCARAEVDTQGGVAKENCLKWLGSHLLSGSSLWQHQQSSYRTHKGSPLPALPPSCPCFKRTLIGNRQRNSAKEAPSATARGVLWPCPPGRSLQLFIEQY